MGNTEKTMGDLKEIFDLEKMQNLQNAVSKNQNIASLILDTNGNNITKPSKFSVGLIRLVRKYPKIDEYFDQGLMKQYKENVTTAAVVRNKTGDMMTGCAPIIIDGKKVATWIIGGVFDIDMMKPDEEYRKLARENDVNEEEFMSGISEVHVMNRGEFLNIFEVVKLFAEQLSDNLNINYAQKSQLASRQELVDELKETNVALQIQAERYRLISECSDEIIFDYNMATDTVVFPGTPNTKIESDWAMTEYRAKQKYREFVHPDDISIYQEMLDRVTVKERDIQFEFRMNLFTSGEYVWYRINVVFFTDDNDHIFRVIGRIHDIDKEKEELMQLESQIKKDPMTGLLNKTATQISVEKFFKECDADSTHALMIVDIDDFKNVNDTFGHLFGDMVIENVAAAISSTFRKSDIVGRIGGDEFLVLMKNTGKRIAEIKARDLGKAVRRKYSNEEKELEITCSIGMAFFADDASNYEDLFGKADIAMYNAKIEGRNTVSVYDIDKEQVFAEITKEDARSSRYDTEFDIDLTQIAFGLLLESRDIDNSVLILTERLADKYSIQMVIANAVEEGEEDKIVSWSKKTGQYSRRFENEFEDYRDVEEILKEKEFVVINDTSKDKKEVEIAKYAAQYGITAMIGCRVKIGNGLEEFFIFANTDAPRCWTEYERKTFKQVSDILALFGRTKREQIKNEIEISRLSSRDPITGLFNRQGFEDEVVKVLEKYGESKHYVMTYIDINNFSYVNENFGVVAGNKMLCNVAEILRSIKNSLVCRIYADHFVVFHYSDEEFDMEKTLAMQDDFFEQQQKMLYSSGKLKLTAGVYNMSYKERNIALAIENANFARKKAKAGTGVFYTVFDQELEIKKDYESRIAGSFERAIEKQEFEMFLQPKINMVSNAVVGAEALVRWRLPDGSYRMPDDFIYILEKYSFIQQLDFAIFEMALKTLERWKKEGLEPVPISVNFSMVNSNSPYFVERVMNLFKQYKVPRRYIEIEVNENAFQEDRDVLYNNLVTLKKKGLTIDLDDFGRGSSTLGSLLSAPVDIVKVDKLFLDGMDDSVIKQDCVSHMCALISSVKKQIVFEGVETKEQADFLYSCGISIVQGFLYGKPVNTTEFKEKYLEF